MNELLLDNEIMTRIDQLNNAAIQHRTTNKPDMSRDWYELNSLYDGWFRIKDMRKSAYGFGLTLINCRVTSQNAVRVADGKAFKVMVDTIDENEEITTDIPMWLYVSDKVMLSDVLVYIANNSYKWRP
jgi:hypothetical protein